MYALALKGKTSPKLLTAFSSSLTPQSFNPRWIDTHFTVVLLDTIRYTWRDLGFIKPASQTSSSHGSSYMARASVLEPPHMHPALDLVSISSACPMRCTTCFRGVSRRWITSHMNIEHPAPPTMPCTSRVPLCSLTMTQMSSVRGSSTTSPRSSRTFSHPRSSSISCHHPIASRTTSRPRSCLISHLSRLSNSSSPRSAIKPRRRSHSFIRARHSPHPSRRRTMIRPTTRRSSHRPTRLCARGHSGHRGIAILHHAGHHPGSTIARRTGATGTRHRDTYVLELLFFPCILCRICSFP
ncbi:hypothetical protein PIB30_055431 [Stylosanthes scabra]|uniref:C2H2-type domain-containing protein n=1 Tax=Stylosanthes scabra TaxID=79078 RepID=A0ABU6RJ03_9FABA|nr:hypothetical protein [Stylosanthes scabra]